MTEDRTGRELTPRRRARRRRYAARAGRAAAGRQRRRRALLRRRAGPHGRSDRGALRPDRPAERQRPHVAFLAVLIVVLFIPVYWFYEIGIPVVGVEGRLGAGSRARSTSPTSSAATRCTWPTARAATANNGEGGVGPPLNDQAKLYNALTAHGLPGHRATSTRTTSTTCSRSAGATSAATRTASCRPGWSRRARSTTARSRSSSRSSPRAGHGVRVRAGCIPRPRPRSAPPVDGPGLARSELHAGARRDARAGVLARTRRRRRRHARRQRRSRARARPTARA